MESIDSGLRWYLRLEAELARIHALKVEVVEPVRYLQNHDERHNQTSTLTSSTLSMRSRL
jgi:hypothetical protein